MVIEPAAFHLLREGDDVDQCAFDEISEAANTIARAVNRGDYHDAMRRFVDYWNREDAWAVLPHQQRAALATRISKVTLDFCATLNDPTRLHDFVDLPTHTLVLSGELSPLPARRICFHLARTLPDVRLQTIEGAGHMLPMTHAAEIYPLVVAVCTKNLDPDVR